jgi:tRNA threonylcarbamoyl adenosine modification protein (Sua5/YciO/YrdC/YwlC family)
VDPAAVALAAEALAEGLVVALPTDTVYGLAVVPTRADAVERLFALKERPREVALPLLIGTADQVGPVAGSLDSAARYLADRYWPGPLTLVVPRAEGFTADLGGPRSARHTVGIRLPDHALVRTLCGRLGPLAVTSANRHGSPPATTAAEVASAFPGAHAPAVVVDGGTCTGTPSTVIECRGPATRCLRQGSIPCEDVFEPPRRGSPDGAVR